MFVYAGVAWREYCFSKSFQPSAAESLQQKETYASSPTPHSKFRIGSSWSCSPGSRHSDGGQITRGLFALGESVAQVEEQVDLSAEVVWQRGRALGLLYAEQGGYSMVLCKPLRDYQR